MKKQTMLLALGATMVLMTSVSKATIVGSKHDFNANTNLWIGTGVTMASGLNTPYKTNSVCSECHQIHHTPDPTKGPLWIHASSAYATSGYKTYEQAGSDTYNAYGLPTPSLGASTLACLSCHDGTVGINETTGLALDGTTIVTATNALKGGIQVKLTGKLITVNGNDLTHTHPIGINYENAQSLYPTELKATATGVWPKTRLKGSGKSQLECATCHDIHSVAVIPSGSQRCLACHNK